MFNNSYFYAIAFSLSPLLLIPIVEKDIRKRPRDYQDLPRYFAYCGIICLTLITTSSTVTGFGIKYLYDKLKN